MDVTVTTDIDVEAILAGHHLGSGGDAWTHAGALVKEYCTDFAPLRSGALSGGASVSGTGNGAEVRYSAAYAHYQYYGRTMGPNVLTKMGWRSMAPPGGKYYTGGALTYSHGGDHWDQKMMAARGGELMAELAAYVGGRAE